MTRTMELELGIRKPPIRVSEYRLAGLELVLRMPMRWARLRGVEALLEEEGKM
jgi:hypothetical protein